MVVRDNLPTHMGTVTDADMKGTFDLFGFNGDIHAACFWIGPDTQFTQTARPLP